MFIRTLDGFLDRKITVETQFTIYVNCSKSDKRRTYNSVIHVEGMGDVGPGKFLITISGSLKGDKLLYDEVAFFTWRKKHTIKKS